MMKIRDSGRGLVRCLGLAAGALLVLSSAVSQRAEALSLINPGAVPTAKYAPGGLTTEVRGEHGGGRGGGGFRGGGVRSGGPVFHASGIRSGSAVFHGGGFRTAHVFRGGGIRYGGFRYGGYRFAHRHHFHRRFFSGPAYYDYPYYSHYRRCRIIWTYYGPRRVCHFRHWHRHHWHHRHHRFHIYW